MDSSSSSEAAGSADAGFAMATAHVAAVSCRKSLRFICGSRQTDFERVKKAIDVYRIVQALR